MSLKNGIYERTINNVKVQIKSIEVIEGGSIDFIDIEAIENENVRSARSLQYILKNGCSAADRKLLNSIPQKEFGAVLEAYSKFCEEYRDAQEALEESDEDKK